MTPPKTQPFDLSQLSAHGFPEKPTEFLRQPPVQKIHFNLRHYSKEWTDQIEAEIAQELAALRERYRLLNSRPSGAQNQAIRETICKKHHDAWLRQRIQMELWSISEKILHPLRTKGMYPKPDESEKYKRMATFIDNLDLSQFPEANPKSNLYLIHQETYADADAPGIQYTAPNGYFEQTQPGLIRDYGYPFYSSVTKDGYARDVVKAHQEKITGINTNFFAAYLGGDKRMGHDVIYYRPEEQFYYFDPVVDCYVPTTEQKLRLGLSQLLQQQAWGQPLETGQMILNRFRTTDIFDEIVNKAKALLAAEQGFFHGAQAKKRITIDETPVQAVIVTIRTFVEESVLINEDGILTTGECLAELKSFCRRTGRAIPSAKEVKQVMQDIYRKGVRHDLIIPDKGCVAGWKGLQLRNPVAKSLNGKQESIKIRESGHTEQSVDTTGHESMVEESLTCR